jgi:hypothetical protein
MVVHIYSPIYLGVQGRRILSPRPVLAKLVRQYHKNKRNGGVVQVERLPSKYQTLNSIPSTSKQKSKNHKDPKISNLHLGDLKQKSILHFNTTFLISPTPC